METSLLIERKSMTVNSPFVSVPVLSNATTFIPAKFSRTSPPLMRNPVLAAFSNAQNVATGVDSTNAHGHALTNRTRANFNHFLGFLALITKGTTANPAAISTTPAIVICIASSFDLIYYLPTFLSKRKLTWGVILGAGVYQCLCLGSAVLCFFHQSYHSSNSRLLSQSSCPDANITCNSSQ